MITGFLCGAENGAFDYVKILPFFLYLSALSLAIVLFLLLGSVFAGLFVVDHVMLVMYHTNHVSIVEQILFSLLFD